MLGAQPINNVNVILPAPASALQTPRAVSPPPLRAFLGDRLIASSLRWLSPSTLPRDHHASTSSTAISCGCLHRLVLLSLLIRPVWSLLPRGLVMVGGDYFLSRIHGFSLLSIDAIMRHMLRTGKKSDFFRCGKHDQENPCVGFRKKNHEWPSYFLCKRLHTLFHHGW
jgi:hypothetical protein